jgi:hypothetical protein
MNWERDVERVVKQQDFTAEDMVNQQIWWKTENV